MAGNRAAPAPLASDLPLPLRAALDLVVAHGGEGGPLQAHPIGRARLVEELGRYGLRSGAGSLLVVLGATDAEVRDAVAVVEPARVLTVGDGPLSLLRRGRRAGEPPLPAVNEGAWRALGYQPVETHGIQGLGSLVWAAAERLCRRVHRHDLADRCKIGMLRTLRTNRLLPWGAVVVVRVYLRVG